MEIVTYKLFYLWHYLYYILLSCYDIKIYIWEFHLSPTAFHINGNIHFYLWYILFVERFTCENNFTYDRIY